MNTIIVDTNNSIEIPCKNKQGEFGSIWIRYDGRLTVVGSEEQVLYYETNNPKYVSVNKKYIVRKDRFLASMKSLIGRTKEGRKALKRKEEQDKKTRTVKLFTDPDEITRRLDAAMA